MRKSPISLGVALFFAWGLSASAASAQSELRLLSEPTSYTDVIDAFDDEDPFDLNVHVGYVRSQTSADITREVNCDGPSCPSDTNPFAGSSRFADIAEHNRLVNTLVLGLDVGLWQDLALYGRLPIVLSDTRKLSAPDNATAMEANRFLEITEPGATTPTHLFTVPFESPTRSGIGEVQLGLAWAIMNQHRDPEYPTWVFMIEGHLGVGEDMNPCEAGDAGCEPGISRGTHALRLETRASHRFRYLEPYGGLTFHVEFPAGAEDEFQPGGDLSGFMNTIPPIVGELTAGVALIPWEHRGRWQRFVIDLRLNAAYISEGHGYSPLYDALGSSNTSYLTIPNNECADPGTGGECRSVPFTGLTDTQSHGRLGGRVALEMQAARYVRFQVGAGLFWESPYLATFADACNPNVSQQPGDPRAGTCRSGIINPHHRASIDMPGRRFKVDGSLTFDFFASATAQF